MDKDVFFSMVEKWTVHDYCTPGIKAEVILDMLLSEFIESLIEYHYKEKYKREIKAKMLTKEFPIKTEAANLRNVKVDYLVSIADEKLQQLLLVELKTTKDSFDKKQLGKMNDAISNGVKDIIGFYCRIIKSKTGNRLDEKKYRNAFYEFYEKEELTKDMKEHRLEKFQKAIIEKYAEADYLYISLPELNEFKENKEKNLILCDYCGSGKTAEEFKKYIEESEDEIYCERWKLVSEILRGCIEFAEGVS